MNRNLLIASGNSHPVDYLAFPQDGVIVFCCLQERSKTKHFRLGKKFLIHSLGKLKFCIWGPSSAKVEKEQSQKRQTSDKGAEDFHFQGFLYHSNSCACKSFLVLW